MMTRPSNPSQNLIKQTVSFFLVLGLGFTFCQKIYSQKTEEKPAKIPSIATQIVENDKGLSEELMSEFTETIKKHTRYTKEKQRYNQIFELNIEQKNGCFIYIAI
jgi:flagellar motor switch protein FliG